VLKRALAILEVVSTAIGNVVGRVILTLFYILLLPPFALWARLRTDALGLRPRPHSVWTPREPVEEGIDAARRQY